MLIGLFAVSAISSCSSDDNDKVQDIRILGSWKNSNDGTVWTFDDAGNGDIKYSSYTISYRQVFTFSFDGKTLKITQKKDGIYRTESYIVDIITSHRLHGETKEGKELSLKKNIEIHISIYIEESIYSNIKVSLYSLCLFYTRRRNIFSTLNHIFFSNANSRFR